MRKARPRASLDYWPLAPEASASVAARESDWLGEWTVRQEHFSFTKAGSSARIGGLVG